jgi:hypothetical protein
MRLDAHAIGAWNSWCSSWRLQGSVADDSLSCGQTYQCFAARGNADPRRVLEAVRVRLMGHFQIAVPGALAPGRRSGDLAAWLAVVGWGGQLGGR